MSSRFLSRRRQPVSMTRLALLVAALLFVLWLGAVMLNAAWWSAGGDFAGLAAQVAVVSMLPLGLVKADQRPRIVGVGTAVRDLFATPLGSGGPGKGKGAARFVRAAGGSIVNMGRQWSRLGSRAVPVALIGRDDDAVVLRATILRDVPGARFFSWLDVTRLSVHLRGESLTERPSVKVNSWEFDNLLKPLLGTVQMLVVGPFSPDDYGIVLQLLKTAPRSCLLLSKEQLRELTPDAVKALMRATDLVILNELEAAIWSGCDDLRDAVRKFREEIGGDILITTHRYVLGHVGGDPVYNKAFLPRAVAQEPGSGDVFTSTLVSMLVDHQEPIDQAVDLALAAAVLHVEGDSNPGALDRMRLVVQDRPRAKVARNHFTTGESRKQRTPAVAAAAAAGLLLALGWGVGQML